MHSESDFEKLWFMYKLQGGKSNKTILSYAIISANVHDSKGFEQLFNKSNKGKDLYLDASYAGQEEIVKKHSMSPIINKKGCYNHSLTEFNLIQCSPDRIEARFVFMRMKNYSHFLESVK